MLDTVLSPRTHLRPAHGPQVPGGTGLERFRLAHRALPGRDLGDVDLTTPLLGAALAAPLVATASGEAVRAAARAASEHGLGLLVGGGPAEQYRTPDRPPLLLAGIALGELLGPDGPERAERLAAISDADAVAIEIDPLGEALVAGAEARYGEAEAAIAAVAERLAPLPVIARARHGTDATDVRALLAAGVAAVDTGGAAFERWGVPTADAVAEAVLVAPDLAVIAGGPVEGVELAVCLALGATAASLAWPFEPAALIHELRVAVWATGAPAAGALTPGHLRSA